MATLRGRFYLKLTPSGNLLGEYSNDDPGCRHCYAEAATRQSPPVPGEFAGTYISTWCEPPEYGVGSAVLEISPAGQGRGIFSLKWTRPGPVIFEGTAMQSGDMLVGDYRGT